MSFGSDDGYFYALKAGDGSLVWKLKTYLFTGPLPPWMTSWFGAEPNA